MKMDYDMVQFTITGVEDVMEFITEVYNEVLKDDDVWHFFDEEEGGIYLRCSTKFSNELHKFLKKIMGYDFIQKSYKEDNYIVKIFPDYFTKFFHLNSLMAIDFYEGKFLPDFKNDEKPSERQIDIAKSIWVGAIAERISHCFLNNLQDYTIKYREQSSLRFGNDDSWESYVLAEQMIDRSIWTGMRRAYLNAKEQVEKGENDTKQKLREDIQT
jgi:hypothetical protein